MYIGKLDDIVNKCNNTYRSNTIKMKPVDIRSGTHIDFNKKNNKEDAKFEEYVRISKYKDIFANVYVPNWSGEDFVIKIVINIVPWTYATSYINGEETVRTFYEKELQKTNQKEFKVGKVIKWKGHKLYVKWKGYNNSFNSWIDKKDLVLMSEYFPKWKPLERNGKVELNLSDYETKEDLKNATCAGWYIKICKIEIC